MSRDKDETAELELYQHAETPKAWLVSSEGDEDQSTWLPKSQVTRHEAAKGDVHVFEVPQWLAEKEGLV